VLQAFAIAFSVVAVLCIAAAIAMTVRGDDNDRRGYLLRATAVVCFALAVVLNVLR
jgi:predicted membrane-bound mannosyltransferase